MLKAFSDTETYHLLHHLLMDARLRHNLYRPHDFLLNLWHRLHHLDASCHDLRHEYIDHWSERDDLRTLHDLRWFIDFHMESEAPRHRRSG